MSTGFEKPPTPGRLALVLGVYYAILVGTASFMLSLWPEASDFLPIGGQDALMGADIRQAEDLLAGRVDSIESVPRSHAALLDTARSLILFVVSHLVGTILVMLPIVWTYKAINYQSGFPKTYVRSLILLPICATTVVLLIQDSLALAFGLAALVAAVRFRIDLDEALDGIFIFAAICVGLATGVGYLGIAVVMGLIFCATNVVLWAKDYGRNPVDEARRARKRQKEMG
ncbi:MAG: DUF4956 domain-containing protein [Chromatiales bacterium]|nr:MAG: DUF4956 domain-containing protein [Chromatiales bacterium]